MTLFDPEKKTAAIFKAGKIPHDEITNVAALAERKQGMLIIGEGVSFKHFRDLPAAMVRAAANGLPVLCLAPAEGSFAVPGSDPAVPQATSLFWRRQDIIRDFDKQLDALAWPPDGNLISTTFALQAEDGSVVARASTDRRGWSWIEARFPDKNGRLALCGLALIEIWNAGPAPRYLLARILEYMASKDPEPGTPKKE